MAVSLIILNLKLSFSAKLKTCIFLSEEFISLNIQLKAELNCSVLSGVKTLNLNNLCFNYFKGFLFNYFKMWS